MEIVYIYKNPTYRRELKLKKQHHSIYALSCFLFFEKKEHIQITLHELISYLVDKKIRIIIQTLKLHVRGVYGYVEMFHMESRMFSTYWFMTCWLKACIAAHPQIMGG
jgi:hypothetical protein